MPDTTRTPSPRRRMIRLSLAGLLGASIAVLQDAIRELASPTPQAWPSPIAILPTADSARPSATPTTEPTSTPAPRPTPPTATPQAAAPASTSEPTRQPGRVVIHIPAPKPAIITRAKWGAAKPAD